MDPHNVLIVHIPNALHAKIGLKGALRNHSFICCRLFVCVSEAAWRLQLFTDIEFAQQIGHISVLEHISTVSDTEDDWLYHSEESESEDEKEAGGPSPSICSIGCSRAQKPASKRSKSETEKSSESGSQSNKSGGWY
jgi:hypothetical protein